MDECNCEKYHRLEDERWRLHQQVHSSEREAATLAKTEVDRRLDEMNELRNQINTERNTYLRADFYYSQHEALRTRLEEIQRTVWLATGGVAVLSFLMSLVAYVLLHK